MLLKICLIEEKPNGGKSHANLQQNNPKQNPTNNKNQRKNTHNKNPTRRRINKRNQQHPQKESRRKRWLLRSSLPNRSNR